MEFVKLSTKEEILQVLKAFLYCFPHLTEKISNLQEYANKLAEYSNFYVLKIEGEVAGMVSFYSNDRITFKGYISLIGVHSRYQKMGLGKRLIQETAEKMMADQMRYMRIEVDRDNVNAQKFYAHLGFAKAEDKADSFYMERIL